MFGRLLVPLFLCLPLFSCGEYVEPYRVYRADFSPAMAEGLENLVREIAAKQDLYLDENRTTNPFQPEEMGNLSLWLFYDKQAHVDQNPILTIFAYLDSGTISIIVYDHDRRGLPIGSVDRLVSGIVGGLEKRLNLNFCREDARWPVCDKEGRPRLLYKADFDPSLTEDVRSLMYDEADARGVHILWIGGHYAERAGEQRGAFEAHMDHGHTSDRGNPEVVVSNMARSSVLTLSAFDHGETPFEDVDDLAEEVKRALERDFGLEFCRANPATSMCDTKQDALEVRRQAWLAARASNAPERLEAFLVAHPENLYAPSARRRLERLRSSMATPLPDIKFSGAGPTGKTFADSLRLGGSGPEMAVIPAGRFLMGCASRPECEYKEGPLRQVSITRSFAMSTHEVTYEDYYRFANPQVRLDESWSRRPVAYVSWGEAAAYAEWLSAQTGATYRLPSEAEWEYAARAGSWTAYAWGDGIDKERARYRRSPWPSAEMLLAPVGTYAANAWGLRDMHGNAAEWVADCWNPDYLDAPADGSSWTAGDCSQRVVRGGSWISVPRAIRSASRTRKPAENRYLHVGFRVVRELPSSDVSDS